MSIADPSTTAVSARIVFQEIGASSWRLCDTSVPPNHADHVVAYLERHGSRYDVVWLRGVHESELFARRSDIVRAAMRRIDRTPVSAATRPVPIPHFPPLTR